MITADDREVRKIQGGYTRLIEEMENRKVTRKDIESLIGVNRVALSRKLHCRRGARFSLEQAIMIQRAYFSDIPIEVLFTK